MMQNNFLRTGRIQQVPQPMWKCIVGFDMRKFVFGLVFVLLLSSCSSGAKSYTLDDLSLYDTGKKAEIRLGMTKAEVESILGGTIEQGILGNGQISGLSVCFRNDSLTLLAVRQFDEDEYSIENYKTSRGITIQSAYEQIPKKYPGSVQSNNDVAVYLMKDGDTFTDITNEYIADSSAYHKEGVQTNVYYIGFGTPHKEESTPSVIYIGDVQALRYMDCDK